MKEKSVNMFLRQTGLTGPKLNPWEILLAQMNQYVVFNKLSYKNNSPNKQSSPYKYWNCLKLLWFLAVPKKCRRAEFSYNIQHEDEDEEKASSWIDTKRHKEEQKQISYYYTFNCTWTNLKHKKHKKVCETICSYPKSILLMTAGLV